MTVKRREYRCPVCGRWIAVYHTSNKFIRHYLAWPEQCPGSLQVAKKTGEEPMPQYTIRCKVKVECGSEETAKRAVSDALEGRGLKPEFMKTTKKEYVGRRKQKWQ